MDEMCLTCSAPHGEHVARMCKPGVQAEKAREITAARSALTRKCMLEAQLKRKMSEAISDKRQTQAMLQAAITDRKTEGEVLFAITPISDKIRVCPSSEYGPATILALVFL